MCSLCVLNELLEPFSLHHHYWAICLKIYIFVAFFCLLLHSFAVSISLQFNCTDPGQQLGDPALLIDLLLWTCPHFRYEQIT